MENGFSGSLKNDSLMIWHIEIVWVQAPTLRLPL